MLIGEEVDRDVRRVGGVRKPKPIAVRVYAIGSRRRGDRRRCAMAGTPAVISAGTGQPTQHPKRSRGFSASAGILRMMMRWTC